MRRLNTISAVICTGFAVAGCAQSTTDQEREPGTDKIEWTRSNPGSGWPALSGPNQNNISGEENVLTDWPKGGPEILWEKPVGTGYSSPVVHRETLVIHHRQGDEEIVEAFHAETGDSLWRFASPTTFQCRYEYSDGPYSTPTITETRVISLGAEAKLHCLDRQNGELIWSRDLNAEFQIPRQLFAFGTSPLVADGRIYINLGAREDDAGVVALDLQNGETVWASTPFGASYATPVRVSFNERELLLVMAYEGLACLDAETGTLLWDYPFRPKKVDSVNACTPQVIGSRVFLTAGPAAGSVVLQLKSGDRFQEVWKDRRALDSQFNPVIPLGGCLRVSFKMERLGSLPLCFSEGWNGSLEMEVRDHSSRHQPGCGRTFSAVGGKRTSGPARD